MVQTQRKKKTHQEALATSACASSVGRTLIGLLRGNDRLFQDLFVLPDIQSNSETLSVMASKRAQGVR